MQQEKKLYTLLVYSENVTGMLSQISAVFTRRQVNVESINASASNLPNIHKYTITAWSDEEQIVKITKAIEKGIQTVVFDRGGYIYHGRVAALAEAAREAGLKF